MTTKEQAVAQATVVDTELQRLRQIIGALGDVDPLVPPPPPGWFKARAKQCYISHTGGSDASLGGATTPLKTIWAAYEKFGDDTDFVILDVPDRLGRSLYSSFGSRRALSRVTIRPKVIGAVTLRGSNQPEGTSDGNLVTINGGERDIEIVGFNVADWADQSGNGTITISGDCDGVRVAHMAIRNCGGEGHLDHTIYLGHGGTFETAPRNILIEDLDIVGPADRRIGAVLLHAYAAGAYGARNVILRRCKARGRGTWGTIISPNYDANRPCSIVVEDTVDVEVDASSAAIDFWYGDRGRRFKDGVDPSCVIRGRHVNTNASGKQVLVQAPTDGGRAHAPDVSIDGASPIEPKDPPASSPTDAELRAYIRAFFQRETAKYGSPWVPGESPIGTTVGGAVEEWVALARGLQAKYDQEAAFAELDRRMLIDIVPASGPAPAPPPAPTGQDERPSIALIRDRMDRSLGHEVLPSIAASMPTWGILQHIVMTPETNPGPQWTSTPPDRSNRTRARGWFCVAGDNARRNTSENSATRIYFARTYLWLRDGRMLASVSRLYDSGMIPDVGLSWDRAVPAVLVDRADDDSVMAVARVNDVRYNGGAFDGRTWHPTLQDVTPGGQLSATVAATLVAVQFGAVPIDPAKPMDPDNLNNCIYPGLDNYEPQQDGISGRFLKVQPWKRWAFAFWGNEDALRRSPPDLPGWID